MVIQYKNWRISDLKVPYGYRAQKKIGTQWKHDAYYPTLGRIWQHVFEQTAKDELEDTFIDFEHFDEAKSLLHKIGQQMDEIKAEILEVCNV
jgi:hypothetical protein